METDPNAVTRTGSPARMVRWLTLALFLTACAAPGADAPPPHLADAAVQPSPGDTTRWAVALQGTACTENGDSVFAPDAVELHPLDRGVDLVQVRCEMAAYQGIYAYLLRDGRAADPRITLVRFPWVRIGDDGAGEPTEVAELAGSPRFDRARMELSVVTRYRGVGDCGEAGVIRFVGTAPELASFRAKPECDGTVVDAAEWPRLRVNPPAPAAAPRTPPPGSAERSAIFDALREDVQRLHGATLRFTARHLAVVGEWAWVEADPADDDGSRLETLSALLREEGGGWRVVEYMPGYGEREGTPLEDACRWSEDLLRRRPAVPSAILPPDSRPPCGG